MHTVLICDPLDKQAVELLKQADFSVEQDFESKGEALKEKIGVYDAVIVRSATVLSKDIIEAGSNLKVIGRSGVGLNNIDLEAAKSRNIAVLNTPGANAISVAELTFALMLATARKLVHASVSLKEGRWEKKLLKGVELYGKTLGIVGFGRIGKEVAKRALAFGMKVIAHDPYVEKHDIEACSAEACDLEDLLKRADVLTVHVPLTEETRGLIGEKELQLMKSNAILINTARGGVVNERALYKALKTGRIAAAGLDVFEKEPPEFLELLKLEKVVCTPHIGASTFEAQKRCSVEIARKIIEWFNKHK
jgi:D-3-phosphoglycerate dehydrogenase